MTTSGRIFDLAPACVDDGPGLRTVVFLKGCALGCPWCHNPEGRSPAAEIRYDAARCLSCQACRRACGRLWPQPPGAWRDGCTACGRCAAVCPAGARQLVGQDLSASSLVERLCEDQDFFAGTGGGVTFSGGEPLLQPDFLFRCAELLRAAGVHVAVETAGQWPSPLVPELAAAADLILFDLKHVDPIRLRRIARPADRCSILQNLRLLWQHDVALELRLTIVPGFNDSPRDLEAIAAWLRDREPPATKVTLLPFHRLAAAKQALYGRAYRGAGLPPVTAAQLGAVAEVLSGLGLECTLWQ